MDDRELLELAAKAAGIEDVWAYDEKHNCLVFETVCVWEVWSPFNDDGDALRLAVKLNLFVDLSYPDKIVGWVSDYKSGICQTLDEPSGNNPYAATRRAIVRAAAEIGKEMK